MKPITTLGVVLEFQTAGSQTAKRTTDIEWMCNITIHWKGLVILWFEILKYFTMQDIITRHSPRLLSQTQKSNHESTGRMKTDTWCIHPLQIYARFGEIWKNTWHARVFFKNQGGASIRKCSGYRCFSIAVGPSCFNLETWDLNRKKIHQSFTGTNLAMCFGRLLARLWQCLRGTVELRVNGLCLFFFWIPRLFFFR